MSFNHRIYSIIKKEIRVIHNFGKDNIVILKVLDKKVSIVTMNKKKKKKRVIIPELNHNFYMTLNVDPLLTGRH